MNNSFKNTRDKLLQQFLDFLWRQWTTAGVPGNQASKGDWIIDPEALVLITTEIGRHDSRLLDLAIDWLHAHGSQINLQRLRRTRGQWGHFDERVLSGIAEILGEQAANRKWKPIPKWDTVQETHRLAGEEEEPLFVRPGGTDALELPNPDPRFRKFGLLRSRWKPRDACQPPRPDCPGNLIFVLRALFGVNARAEVMAWLLTHGSGYALAIARDTGYSQKAIQVTLTEMEGSGQFRSERHARGENTNPGAKKRGRERTFRLNPEDWKFLIKWDRPEGFPRWIHWPLVYYFAYRTLMLLGEPETPGATERLRAIQQRGFLDEIAPSLRDSSLRSKMTAHPDLTGQQLTDAILRDAGTLGQLMENDFAGETWLSVDRH